MGLVVETKQSKKILDIVHLTGVTSFFSGNVRFFLSTGIPTCRLSLSDLSVTLVVYLSWRRLRMKLLARRLLGSAVGNIVSSSGPTFPASEYYSSS
jgi:hypothetical protein